jgi:regulator of RNase E activity RraA
MDRSLLDLLKSVDTPTVCNAIEVVQGKRGFAAFTRSMPVATAPDASAIVGYASTAKIAGRFPSPESPGSIRQRRMEYYRHMANTPKPAVVVIEDIDFPECVGAFWGEINATVHKGFGLAGVVTNGLVRDLGDLPEDFPILAGSVGPSHAFVHVTGFGLPVEVMGLAVSQGDLIHADRHGALVIPPDVVPRLAEGIRTLMETERIVLETARDPDFDLGKFEDAWARFERART